MLHKKIKNCFMREHDEGKLNYQKQPPEGFCKTLFKKRLWHRCFPVNFAKFLRTPFSQNTSGRLLLNYMHT